MIYEWWAGSGKYAGYLGATDEDERKVNWCIPSLGDPLPPLAEWQPPHLEQYLGEKGKRKPRPIGDSPSSGAVQLISQRAVDALRDIWDRHALLYPVILADAPEQPYFMVVAQTVLDCLDREKSVGKTQKYGPTPDLFAVIHNWVFDEACVGDADVFRLPDSNTSIYVSERFKERVVAAKLKGFQLKTEFWEEKPFVS